MQEWLLDRLANAQPDMALTILHDREAHPDAVLAKEHAIEIIKTVQTALECDGDMRIGWLEE